MKKLFILSTKAGYKNFIDFGNNIYETYRSNNRIKELEIQKTLHKNHAGELAKNFAAENSDGIIYVCGGDGSLNEVANSIFGTDTSLGLIPMGTANDFSKNFNYKNFKIEDTFAPDLEHIDMIKINEKYCLNIMSLGFDTVILNTAYEILEKCPGLQSSAYLLSVLKSLKNIETERLYMNLTLETGDEIDVKGNFIISALCNGSYYGSGFNPAPTADLSDGLLNLITLEETPFFKLIPLIFKYRKGTHLNDKRVKEYIVKKGIIKSDKKIIANIDGEIFKSDVFDFEIIENAITFHKVGVN
ncbi:diacylglycerol kinase catalytic subunit [Peptoniphilus sp. ING2-D1G]|nr:diacylglycerol kinase catalytic subunit [Peptoniphilus sp. ING2-D1G]